MNIEQIINESIEEYLSENLFQEKKKKKDKDKGKSKVRHKRKPGKNAIKAKNGRRINFDYDEDKRNNPDVNASDAQHLCNVLNQPGVNQAAVAHAAYPDLTPNGAQSKLRKKAKHIKSDSGYIYRFKNKEAHRILKKCNDLGIDV